MAYERDDVMIERMLCKLNVDVSFFTIEHWTADQAEQVERWCTAMLASNPVDGLCVRPIPRGLSEYIHEVNIAPTTCSYGHRCPNPSTCTIGQPERKRQRARRHRE